MKIKQTKSRINCIKENVMMGKLNKALLKIKCYAYYYDDSKDVITVEKKKFLGIFDNSYKLIRYNQENKTIQFEVTPFQLVKEITEFLEKYFNCNITIIDDRTNHKHREYPGHIEY